MPPNVWQEVVRMQSLVVVRWAKMLAEGVDVLGPGTPAGKRMAEYAAFFDFVTAEYSGLLDSWEARTAAANE
jgi:hypothetical protein